MANVFATKNGNWSDTTVWNTGALPTAADDVWANTFTIAIDTSPTVLSVRNGTTTNVTAGGSFVPTNGITLTCTGAGLVAGAISLINFSLASPSKAIINAAVPGASPGTAGTIIIHSGSGTLDINGNITGPTGFNSQTINFSGVGVLNITGTVTGGSSIGNICPAILLSGAGTLNVTGNISGSSTVNTANGPGISMTGNGVCNATGSLSSFVAAAISAASGSINIIGNVVAQGSASAVVYTGTGSLTVSGSCTPANNVVALSTSNTSATVILSGPFLVSANGTHAVYSPNWKWANTNPPATRYEIRTANLATIRPLYTADSVGGNPAISNVRSGTVYGPSNELTGTCAVPAAGSVALGVPVDNTTGTAVLSLSDVQTAATNALTAASAVTLNQPITSLTTPNSIGERFKNSATVATVAQQISDAISSRQ